MCVYVRVCMCVCVCVFQGLGGGVPSLYHSRERRSEVLVKAGVVSEKEAVLLGESEQNQSVKTSILFVRRRFECAPDESSPQRC